jgi:hypothetical protein
VEHERASWTCSQEIRLRFLYQRITIGVSSALANIAPNDLTYSNNQHDCAVQCPMLVALHEAATEGSPRKI